MVVNSFRNRSLIAEIAEKFYVDIPAEDAAEEAFVVDEEEAFVHDEEEVFVHDEEEALVHDEEKANFDAENVEEQDVSRIGR